MKFIISFILCHFFCVKVSAQTHEWVKQIQSRENFFGTVWCIETDDSGYVYVTGYCGAFYYPEDGSDSISNQGGTGYLIKLSGDGELIWHRPLPGRAFITVDRFNNIQVSGDCTDHFDFDPGPDTAYANSQSENANRFVARYNTQGNLIWVTGFYTTNSVNFAVADPWETNQHSVDFCGNTYVGGLLTGNLNVSQDGVNLANADHSSYMDSYILKVDNNGRIIWCKYSHSGSPDPNGYFWLQNVLTTPDGNLVLTGNISGLVDLDFSNDSIHLNGSTNYYSGCIIYMTPEGDYIKSETFKGGMRDAVITSEGTLYISGFASPAVDFDFGPGVYDDPDDPFGMFMACYKNGSEFRWVKFLENGILNSNYLFDMTSDPDGNIYATGASSDMDLDMGPGEVIENNSDENAGYFVAKWDSSGNYLWSHKFRSNAMDGFQVDRFVGLSIDINHNGDVLTAGRFGFPVYMNPDDTLQVSIPYPVSNSYYMRTDGFIQKFSQNYCHHMALGFNDVTAISCSGIASAAAVVTNTSSSSFYSWNTVPATITETAVFNAPGYYTVTVSNDTCSRSSTLFIPGPVSQDEYDLQTNLICDQLYPGINTIIQLDAFNGSCANANGTLKLELSELVEFNYAIPPPDSISGRILKWNFSNWNYDSGHFKPLINITALESAGIGDSIYLSTTIDPVINDVVPLNNSRSYNFPVLQYYNSNNKKVYPEGKCEPHFITKDEVVSTTINFQNTGDCIAKDVFIIDTIAAGLDPASFRISGSSHVMYAEIISTNVFKFKFDNIMLPDSGSDELTSKGYIIYEATVSETALPGTALEHKAGQIYFDNFPFIFTNTAFQTITDSLRSCFPLPGTYVPPSQFNFIVHPNPAFDQISITSTTGIHDKIAVDIFDGSGRIVKFAASDNATIVGINLESLSEGIYCLRIISGEVHEVHKIVKVNL